MNSQRHFIITGGAGFLGSSLVGELLSWGNKVAVLDCLLFGGDMGDITTSFEKITDKLGFRSQKTVDDGIRELLDAIQLGLVKDPADSWYRNARFIVQ